MESLFNINGLMFWTEREIRIRNQFVNHYASEVNRALELAHYKSLPSDNKYSKGILC